ncbi:hypothetical protein K3495_g8611 [Podosphaera aphanis]|nr:hypothetical protein K3495_g8611 [Podosphaera aphanis]
MIFKFAACSVFLWVGIAQAICTSNLLIDNYDYRTEDIHSATPYTFDDETTSDFKLIDTEHKVTFKPKDENSYVFTDFNCLDASNEGYNALSLSIKAPSNGATITIELQTSSSCSTSQFTRYYTNLTNLNGNMQTYIVPLDVFTGANLNAVQSIVYKDFTPGEWEIGASHFSCMGATQSESAQYLSSEETKEHLSEIKQQPLITRRATNECAPLLVEDFASQSRLTFLFYNSLLQPSSDDGSMKAVTGRVDTQTSVIVSDNHVTLTPKDTNSYWFTQMGCLQAATNQWGGVGLTIKAAPGTSMRVELSSDPSCTNKNPKTVSVMAADLGWTFDGTEKYYQVPFSKFPGLDTEHLSSLLFSGLNKAISLGPIALYCGETGSAYPVPATIQPTEPSSTVPTTIGSTNMVIDTFNNRETNALGFYHGGDEPGTYTISNSRLTINMKGDADQAWYSQLANGCSDLTPIQDGYLHIAFSGSNAFSISLQQHNPSCDDKIQPVPFTWDSVEASRYSNSDKTDIYVPLTHFNIDRSKSIGIGLKGFYSNSPTSFSKIEITKSVPEGFLVPSKLPTAPLIFACTRPNSFAFAIDDGEPKFAQRVVSTIAQAGIKVTFFTVGAALLDPSTNLTGVYKGMLNAGHQVAYHSFTHPPMEGLPSLAAIDWELNNDIEAVQKTLGITSKYFRPPFGTEGARVRQRLESLIPGSKFVMWSVDVQDYMWASGSTPEKQITNFQSDVDKGGNLVVMHYLYESTVSYLPKFIAIAKATGKQLMRVDQCMEDPEAPPL